MSEWNRWNEERDRGERNERRGGWDEGYRGERRMHEQRSFEHGGGYGEGDYRGGMGAGGREPGYGGQQPYGGQHFEGQHQPSGAQRYGGGQQWGGQPYGSQQFEGQHRPSGAQPYGGQPWGEQRGGYGMGGRESAFGGQQAYGGGQQWGGQTQMQTGRGEERSWMARQGEHRGRGPKNYTRSDERIREDVNDRLSDDPWLDASEVDVQVSKCEVTLTGTVHSREDKRRAEDVAEQVSGVKHVQNNLRVLQAGGQAGMTAGAAGASQTSGSTASRTS